MDTDNIRIEYEMSFILQVFADANAFWRIQGTAQCVFSIPGPEAYDWSIFRNMNKQQMLAHKNLLNFESLTYDFMECDTTSKFHVFPQAKTARNLWKIFLIR